MKQLQRLQQMLRAPFRPGGLALSPFAYRMVRSACAALLVLPGLALADPITWGDSVVKPPGWPKNSTLHVYIQPDPKGQGRDELIKTGVERWKKTLSDRMVGLEVSIGNPPADAQKPIRYTWEADGTKTEDNKHELGAGKDDAFAGPDLGQDTDPGGKPIPGTESFEGGSAKVRNALPAATDKDKEYLKNLGEHEMTHIIGLADGTGDVTKHKQSTSARSNDQSTTLNESDLKEINALYGTAGTGGAIKPQGQVTPLGPGATPGTIRYRVDFVPANTVPVATDPEHVPVVNFAIDPALISGFDLPLGWIGLLPNPGVAIDDPFFIPGDSVVAPAPWDPAIPMRYVAFRASTDEALLDGLPDGFDPALTVENPLLFFTLHLAPDYKMGLVDVWAGGDLQRVSGPIAVSEAPTLSLLALALLCLGLGNWAAGLRPLTRHSRCSGARRRDTRWPTARRHEPCRG